MTFEEVKAERNWDDNAPIVPKFWYPDGGYAHELDFFLSQQCEPGHEPVVMKGARRVMRDRYRTMTAYGEIIVDRWMRRKKVTAIEWEEKMALQAALIKSLERRPDRCNSSRGYDWFFNHYDVWIDGKRYMPDKKQLEKIRELHGLWKKMT